jgi:hypothetical protein
MTDFVPEPSLESASWISLVSMSLPLVSPTPSHLLLPAPVDDDHKFTFTPHSLCSISILIPFPSFSVHLAMNEPEHCMSLSSISPASLPLPFDSLILPASCDFS